MNDLFVYNEHLNQVLLMKVNFSIDCVRPNSSLVLCVACSVYLSLLQTPEDSEESVSPSVILHSPSR